MTQPRRLLAVLTHHWLTTDVHHRQLTHYCVHLAYLLLTHYDSLWLTMTHYDSLWLTTDSLWLTTDSPLTHYDSLWLTMTHHWLTTDSTDSPLTHHWLRRGTGATASWVLENADVYFWRCSKKARWCSPPLSPLHSFFFFYLCLSVSVSLPVYCSQNRGSILIIANKLQH